MAIRWLLAAIHLIALGIGLGAVWARARALREELNQAGLHRVFAADGWWGIAALLWIVTGLIRVFSSLEKGAAYYLHNHLFYGKMALLLLILALEIYPMTTLIKWRKRARQREPLDLSSAPRMARISVAQAVAVIGMVLAATGMARGYGSQ